jgi:hypothetical protein
MKLAEQYLQNGWEVETHTKRLGAYQFYKNIIYDPKRVGQGPTSPFVLI